MSGGERTLLVLAGDCQAGAASMTLMPPPRLHAFSLT